MNEKSNGRFRRLAIVMLLCLTGCVSDHLVDVTVTRIDGNAQGSNGLTEAQAQELFKDVARQFGFHVTGPIRQPAGQEPQVQYFASRAGAPGYINAYITSNAVSFYTVSKTWETSRNLASSFEQALEKRGVHYQETRRHGGSFN